MRDRRLASAGWPPPRSLSRPRPGRPPPPPAHEIIPVPGDIISIWRTAINAIFGPSTHRVLAFIAHLPGLSADKIDLVTSAWKQAPGFDRAEAWARLCRATTQQERYRILAASLARREAMDAACGRHRADWAFWAAACEVATAIAAGDRISRHYDILTAPLAAVMPADDHEIP